MQKVKLYSEHLHQVTLVSWFDRNYKEYSGRLFAIPNGGLRAKSVAIKLSLEGVRRGIPDLFLPIPRGCFHGMFIELKTEKGRPTKDQKEWIEYLSLQGYKSLFSYGWEDASEAIKEYMNIRG